MDWKVRNMPPDTVSKIKELASVYNMPIAEFLAAEFDDRPVPKLPARNENWYIRDVSRYAKQQLRRNARKRKMSLQQYLEWLAEQDFKTQAAVAKLNKIKKILDN